MVGLLVGLQATDHNLAGGDLGGGVATRHQPLDDRIEHGRTVDRLGQPVVLVGPIGAQTVVGRHRQACIEQAAVGQGQADVDPGHIAGQAQIAPVHTERDGARSRSDRRIDHHGTARAAGSDAQVASGRGRPGHCDRARSGGQGRCATSLLQAVDQHGARLDQANVAAARVANIERGHVDLDRVVERADAADGLDHELCGLGDDVDAALGRINDLTRRDVQVAAVGAAQLAQQDLPIGFDAQGTTAGVDFGLARHGQGAAAVEPHIAAGRADVAAGTQRHVPTRGQRHRPGRAADGLVERDRRSAACGGQLHRVGAIDRNRAIDRQLATGHHLDRVFLGTLQALDHQVVKLVNRDRVFGADGDRVHLHRRVGRAEGDAARGGAQRDLAARGQGRDVDVAELGGQGNVARQSGDGADVDVALGDDGHIAS